MERVPIFVYIMAAIAVVFGGMTLVSGSSTLFFDGEARAAAGNYVGFVLWFNFLAGFAYILAGVGLAMWQRWAVGLSGLIALATLIVFLALGAHILLGGAWETRTVGAMVLRSGIWTAIAWFARRAWKESGNR